MLKIQKPKIHDNTDQDVIAINRTKLSYNLELVRRFCFSAATVLTWLGLATTFIVTALITDKFKNIGSIPGETIRTVFIFLGIAGFILFIKDGWRWYKLKDKYDPDALVKELLEDNPQDLESATKNKERLTSHR
ncbi:MAG: hypothetical protein Q8Q17_02990 [bacterium]|nr:hypothetical protein [bacterium]